MPLLRIDQLDSAVDQPAPAWLYETIFPDVEGVAAPPPMYVLDDQLTFPYIDAEARFVGGTYMHYPKEWNIDALSFSFYEDRRSRVTKYLIAWQELIVSSGNTPSGWDSSRAGNFNCPAKFKKELSVQVYDLEHKRMGTHWYRGVFPLRPDGVNYSYDHTAQTIRRTCSFSVDGYRFIPA